MRKKEQIDLQIKWSINNYKTINMLSNFDIHVNNNIYNIILKNLNYCINTTFQNKHPPS